MIQSQFLINEYHFRFIRQEKDAIDALSFNNNKIQNISRLNAIQRELETD